MKGPLLLRYDRSGEADAVAGEEAVGRAVRALPQGSAPRPSNVEKFVIEYRDIKEPLSSKH